MKARMALVTFWIFASLLGPLMKTQLIYGFVLQKTRNTHQPTNTSNCVTMLGVPLLCALYITLLHLPVHDVSNERTRDQAQQLQGAEHG